MEYLQQSFTVKFEFKVFFTSVLFNTTNTVLNDFLISSGTPTSVKKILFVVDQGVLKGTADLPEQIRKYFTAHKTVQLIDDILILPGGETIKNDPSFLQLLLEAVNTHGIDRHSYIAAIGGGSLLDLVGYAAAISHRGVKHIRIPTTVLSQNDSGVGVKNSMNYFGKKNFLGTFTPPAAVFNDDLFLSSLSNRDWRSGISEAIKVALIKDLEFFEWLEANALALTNRDLSVMNYLIRRCAELHLNHIAGSDPFERGSLRPLDFGHWSAHKLEQLTGFEVLHGEAVAMGIALDTVYSNLCGRLSDPEVKRVILLFQKLGFNLSHPYMQIENNESPILVGLEEFREHLGGELTIMLLNAIGEGTEVHEIDTELLKQAGKILNEYQSLSLTN